MKNKKLFISISFILCCFFGTIIINSSINRNTINFNTENRKILIDPGHGGIDGGASSKWGTLEKKVNLEIALKLKVALNNLGYSVFMTREEDIGLYNDRGTIHQKKIEDLTNRVKLISYTGANVFVSIHLNKFPESKYYGAQVWYSNKEESKILGNIIQEGLKKDIQNGNKRIEKSGYKDYKILRESSIPSVIVECGFISNYEEDKLLNEENYQNKLAISIANSIDKFYKNN